MSHKDVLAAIDKEIARLQQARDILSGGVTEAPVRRRKSAAPAKSAGTKRAAKKTAGKRVLSADARKRIADAQKRRWAAQKAGK